MRYIVFRIYNMEYVHFGKCIVSEQYITFLRVQECGRVCVYSCSMDYIVLLERPVCVCAIWKTCSLAGIQLFCQYVQLPIKPWPWQLSFNPTMDCAHTLLLKFSTCNEIELGVFPCIQSYYTAGETTGFYSLEKSCYAI